MWGGWRRVLSKKWRPTYPLFGYSPLLRFRSQYRLKRLCTYAVNQIPFYRDLKEIAFENWPVVDKQVVKDRYCEFNSKKLNLEALKHSSSDRIVQYADEKDSSEGAYLFSQDEINKSAEDTLRKLLSSFPKDVKIAFFHGGAPYFRASRGSDKIRWEFFDLNNDFTCLKARLMDFLPDVVIAPPQALIEIAKIQENDRIDLSFKKVVSTDSVLSIFTQHYLSKVFKQPIHQLYQCAEGWLGTTCRYGSLHLNEDIFYIEKHWICKKQRRFIPIVTTLNQRLQPLIRYRMEDILVEKTHCSCNSPFTAIETMVGRCQDVLYFPRRTLRLELEPLYQDVIENALQSEGLALQQFQLNQANPKQLTISILSKEFESVVPRVEEKLKHLFDKQDLIAPILSFVPLQSMRLNERFRPSQRHL